jgi:hypothetical protein
MHTTLTIPDKKTAPFLDDFRNTSSVKIKPTDTADDFNADEPAPTTEEFYEGLKRAVHDVNEAIAGRLQLQTLDELLDELESRTNS